MLEYESFTQDYHWIVPEERLGDAPYHGILDDVLSRFDSSDVAILDCSCGIGVDAIALARRGYRVHASDASQAMVEETRRRAREAGVSLPATQCFWEELPDTVPGEFDIVVSWGNSLAHAGPTEQLHRSLRGMHQVLKDGGLLVVGSRNWDKLLDMRYRFEVRPSRVQDGVRCQPVHVFSLPERFGDPGKTDIVLCFEEDGRTYHRVHEITYCPYRAEDLEDQTRIAGFRTVELRHAEDRMTYAMFAWR